MASGLFDEVTKVTDNHDGTWIAGITMATASLTLGVVLNKLICSVSTSHSLLTILYHAPPRDNDFSTFFLPKTYKPTQLIELCLFFNDIFVCTFTCNSLSSRAKRQ